jgi:glycosyltransferase involved in cell wall biosynthesis
MTSAAWGGSEELWFRSALHAARAGHDVGCVVYGWPAKRERLARLEAAGCRVIELPNRGRAKRTWLEKLEYECLTRLRQRARAARLPFGDYDIVVFNQGGTDEIAGSQWRSLPDRLGRYALTFHSYREDLVLDPKRAPRLRRWMEGAQANLFASDRIRAVLEDRLGGTIPNAAVLTNPITFAVPDAPAPLPPATPLRLLMLSALRVEWKAQDQVIRALAGPAWRERDFVLELCGEGPDEAQLRSLVASTGLEGRVLFRGHTDPEAALRSAHLVLQTSRVESVSLSVMEAMAVGRPVLVSRLGDMPVWVRDGENGWVCPDASVASIAAGLETAWRARDRWAQMGERSHRLFRERYPRSVEETFLAQVTAGAPR